MTIAVVQHAKNTGTANANTLAITVSSTGAGNLLVVAGLMWVNANDARTITGVSDGTTAFTHAAGADGIGPYSAGDGASSADVWYLPSSAAGKTTITITFSGAAGTFYKYGHFWEVSGLPNAVVDAALGGSTTSASSQRPGKTVTTTATSGFAVGCAIFYTCSSNPYSGNEFTAGGDITSGGGSAGCSLIYSTAANHTPNWGENSAVHTYAASTAAFKTASSAVNSGFFAFM